MSDFRILIVADSRGRLLDIALSDILSNYNYKLLWRKGLRIHQTADFILPTIESFKPHMVLLLMGICDITTIRFREPWTVALRHLSPEVTTYNFMAAVDNLHSQLFPLSERLGHHLMIIMSSQTGIDIGAYNGYPYGLASPEQPLLDKSITMINKQLSLFNKSMAVVTPFLSSAIHMRCRGRYRTAYGKLADGCHPTLQLCRVWAHKLRHNIESNMNAYDHYALINQMYNL